MRQPDVSVITVSFSRAAWVLLKLRSLSALGVPPERLEVVLVDNACPDGVGAQVEAVEWPFAVKVLRLPQRIAAGPARAMAADLAQGRWLWWSDDDVLPDRDALRHHLHRQLQRPGVTIGAVRFLHQGRLSSLPIRAPSVERFTGVNTMFERAAWLRVRPAILELPRAYGGEDTAVGYAMKSAGVHFSAVSKSWVTHLGPAPTLSSDLERAFDAGFNARALADRYPTAAFPLGVHDVQLILKRALFEGVFAFLLERCWPATVRFERSYLNGARAFRGEAREESGNGGFNRGQR